MVVALGTVPNVDHIRSSVRPHDNRIRIKRLLQPLTQGATMNVRQTIKDRLTSYSKHSVKSAAEYEQVLLKRLQTNLKTVETKRDGTTKTPEEKIADNAGLIARIKAVKPRGLNQMQQAFADAIA